MYATAYPTGHELMSPTRKAVQVELWLEWWKIVEDQGVGCGLPWIIGEWTASDKIVVHCWRVQRFWFIQLNWVTGPDRSMGLVHSWSWASTVGSLIRNVMYNPRLWLRLCRPLKTISFSNPSKLKMKRN